MNGDRVLHSESAATDVSFSEDGARIGAICRDGKVRVWELITGTLVKTMAREEGAAMFAGARGQYGVIGTDGRLTLRRLDAESPVRQVAGPQPRPSRLAAAEQGGLLAAAGRPYEGSSENLVRVWSADGRERYKLPAGLGGVSSLAFSPDGETLVAAAYDTDVRIWNARNGELKRVIDELLVSMFELSFSPDGRYLAMAGVDRIVYIWDTASWRVIQKIAGQPEMISALEFSPDGRRIVTGGMNETAFGAAVSLIVWDVATAKRVRTVTADHRVSSAVFSHDGKLVAAADGDGTIGVWAVP